MRKAFTSICLSLALAGAAAGAEIHGTFSENGRTLPEGVSVKLDCGTAAATAKTDGFGSYSLRIDATGVCRLAIEYKGSSPSLKLTVYEKPSRYDLVVKEEGGKMVLVRK